MRTMVSIKSTVAALSRVVVPLQVKADAVQLSERTFEGLAAVWSLDLGNDIIKRGAFKGSLAEWRKSGEALPLLNSHNHWDVMSALGQMLDAQETKDGLWTKWEVIDGADGDAVLARLRPSERTGRAVVGKMSIGYEPIKWSFEQPPGSDNPWDRIRHLDEISLKEVSLVLFPMAPGASIDASSVKSFVDLATNTDPALVSPETKHELRRLASRIGTLLAPTRQKSEASDTTPISSPPSPGTPTIDQPPPPPSTPPTTTPELPAPVAPTTPVVPSAPPPAPPTTTSAEKSGVDIYVFSEALSHRLRRTLLTTRMSDLGDTG